MARAARQVSSSGYYHVIVRGNGKQILFEETQDYFYFLKILKRFSEETEVKVCAYCLMENHAHFLLNDPNRVIPLMMKKIGVSYSWYYNKKYDRSGHLFQDRYKSEAVEDDAYLLTAFRYILKNPQKAGICPAAKYKWSSYALYGDSTSFVDTSLLQELIGDFCDYEKFIAKSEDEDDEYEHFISSKRDDEWAKQVIRKKIHVESGTEIRSYPKSERNQAIAVLRDAGLSVRQIERLTGIPRGQIQYI